MKNLLEPEALTSGDELAGHQKSTGREDPPFEAWERGNRESFARHEHAQLEAWDQDNLPLRADDAFEHRLLSSYHEAERASLRALNKNDEEICSRIAADAGADDADAFREIASEHVDYLHRIARRLSGDNETAKDLVQETLVRGWSNFGQFRQGSNVRAWLVTILTRLYYDQLKHAKVIRRAEPDLVTLETVDREMTVPSIPDATLWAAVQALDVELREVVERCYVRQMSYKAIAEELKLPIGTIGTRLKRARERLKTLLTTADAVEP